MNTARILVAVGLILSGSLQAQEPQPHRWDASLAGFDTVQFIHEQRPFYLPWAQAISHYSAYYSSHPLAILALMDLELAANPDAAAPDSHLLKSFSAGADVRQRIQALALALSGRHRGNLEQRIASVEASQKRSGDGFAVRLQRLKRQARLPDVVTNKGAAPDFQLPTKQGQPWQFSGVHSNLGLNDGSPMSAIDLAGDWYDVWGDNVSIYKVSASHGGVVSVSSSCFVLVTHDSGWMTGYYHLNNIQVTTGQRVRAGQVLAEYANNIDQALCLGGHSQGPHQHFSLRFDGTHIPLDQRFFSGYQVRAGSFDYDSHPSRMYLEKAGVRFVAFQSLIANDEPLGVPSIDHTFNGMWYQPALSGHGLNLVVQRDNGAATLTVFVTFFTYDDAGLANFYAGNVTVESWDLGEPLTVPMLQTRNGGFTTPVTVDPTIDVSAAGDLTLTLQDCQSGVLAFAITERTSGALVSNEYPIEKLLGAPDCNQ